MTRLPVLSFHSIDDSGSVISIGRRDFAALMTRLATDGWRGRTLSEALGRLGAGAEAGPGNGSGGRRCFGLSFDDGYLNVTTEALPVLRDLDFTATVFVIAGRCGADNRWPGQARWVPPMDLLDWPDLEMLARAGWEIGSHGLEHRPLTTLDTTAVSRDLEQARERIEARLGVPSPLLAYPYGAHDEAVCEIAARHHEAAFIDAPRLIAATDLGRPFRLPRVDAHYLRWFPASVAMAGGVGRAYLAARRWIGRLHGRHWDPAGLGAAGGRT